MPTKPHKVVSPSYEFRSQAKQKSGPNGKGCKMFKVHEISRVGLCLRGETVT